MLTHTHTLTLTHDRTHIYIYSHVHTHKHIHTHTHICTHTLLHTDSDSHQNTFVYTHALTLTHIHTFTELHSYTQIHTLLHTNTPLCARGTAVLQVPGCESCDILKSSVALRAACPRASPVAPQHLYRLSCVSPPGTSVLQLNTPGHRDISGTSLPLPSFPS